MSHRLSRLLAPRSLAVIGGGAWAEAVIRQAQALGFDGAIWPIHPAREEVAGLRAFRVVSDLPDAPDAAFVGINREAAIGAVERLRRAGAGGAVAFASGFAEAEAEMGDGRDAQTRLAAAAGDMPVLGPNCYGLINALERLAIWPDQHGLEPVSRGVAILTQSSNLAISLTFQSSALPLAFVGTCGNAALVSQAELALALLDDSRITAIGLHVEGFADLRGWEALARRARDRRVPLLVLKAGESPAARAATVSHTAALTGSASGARALLRRLGIGQVNTLSALVEALMLAHGAGFLPEPTLATVSCSGGEAALAADIGAAAGIRFPVLTEPQRDRLRLALGPKVALANPLDYHTYIWRDVEAMTRAWTALADGPQALTATIVDFPDPERSDPRDWDCAMDAAIATRRATEKPLCLVSTLAENLPRATGRHLLSQGVIPIRGLPELMAGIRAVSVPEPKSDPLYLPDAASDVRCLTEAEAKARLRAFGLPVPSGRVITNRDRSGDLPFPVVAKSLAMSHRTGAGGIALDLKGPAELDQAIAGLPEGPILVEEMISGVLTEVLVGMVHDPAHGLVMTIGAGGVLAEVLADTATLLVPARRDDVEAALRGLRMFPLLEGYRGQPAIDLPALAETITALQRFVTAARPPIVDLEINPLLCTADRIVIGDALLSEALS